MRNIEQHGTGRRGELESDPPQIAPGLPKPFEPMASLSTVCGKFPLRAPVKIPSNAPKLGDQVKTGRDLLPVWPLIFRAAGEGLLSFYFYLQKVPVAKPNVFTEVSSIGV